MSAPSRGRGGAAATRGNAATPRGRGSFRGNTSSTIRGRGRGRGRGGGGGDSTVATPVTNAGGLLQKLRTGTVQRSPDNGTTPTQRGRGNTTRAQFGGATRARGSISKAFNTPQQPRSTPSSRASSPAPPASHRDFMAQMNETFQLLKPKRDAERKKAIQDGFLSDPEKKTSLANAITPVGTCIDMCPQFERVERIVQNMVDRAEKVPNTATGRDMPSEDRMVKRFRRSAAGYDEQLPSDIRTPDTLRRTLDYLLDKIVNGGERLASIHKFVWDRTRGIRNDFSIQQVSRREDVTIAVDCYERIARFHILSLHQLANPNNLQEGEHFDAHQEREQLNNTLLSLMYYYDDNRGVIPLPNEPEFRAYCILFELQSLTPDLEDRMQTWPVELLNHPQVQTAFQLYAAAASTIPDQGPLRPSTPFSVAQANSGKFWTILSSQAVPYIMACVAEMHFSIVRFTALDALWRSAKSSPQGQQARNQDWTLPELQNYLAFDNEEETLEFCEAFDLAFKNNDSGEQCLDFVAVGAGALDKSSIPSQQIFSHDIVEHKRHRRTLVAVINGINVAAAIRQGFVVEADDNDNDEHDPEQQATGDDQSMFIPEKAAENTRKVSPMFGSLLNPAATTFTPSTVFGEPAVSTPAPKVAFAPPQSTFGAGSPFPASNLQPTGTQGDNNGAVRASPASQPGKQAAFSSIFGQTANTGPFSQPPAQPPAQQPVSSPAETNAQGATASNIFGQSAEHLQSQTQGFSFTPGIMAAQAPMQAATPSTFFENLSRQLGTASNQPQPPTPSNSSNMLPKSQPVAASNGQRASSVIDPGPIFIPKQVEPAATPETRFVSPFQATSAPSIQSAITPTPQFLPSFATSQKAATPSQPADTITQNFQSTIPPAITFAPSPSSTAEAKASPLSSQHGSQNATTKQPEPVKSSFPSLPSFEPSTTPQGTPQRSQLNFQLPPVGLSQADTSSKTARQSCLNLVHTKPQPSTPPTSSPAAQVITTPFVGQQNGPVEPKFTETDHANLVENTARLILTQPRGLIEYFVSHHVSNILQPLVKQWLQDQVDTVMTRIRTRHLSRKFFAIWRENTQRSVLSRRAKQRRKLLQEAMLAEQLKRQRDEAELEAILAATRETKRFQEEHKRLNDLHRGQRIEEQRRRQEQQDKIQATQLAGQKRKIISTTNSPKAVSDIPRTSVSTHKRSRTISTMSEPTASLRSSTSSLLSSRFGQSHLGQSINALDMRKPISQKVDATRTDYFKLKAMGIDPNTPLIPDTARSLELKKNKEQEAKEALVARFKARPSAFSNSISSRHSTPVRHTPPKAASAPMNSPHPPSPQHNVKPSISTTLTEEDTFLRELQEARQSLASDAGWFKDQTAVLQKEMEDYEELRRSQSARPVSRQETPQISVNGLTKTNGYSYRPADLKPGKTMSRTEQRIRETGAHGLATKPLGTNYIPVAMSRQSALQYSYGAGSEVLNPTKARARDIPGLSNPGRTSSQSMVSNSPKAKRTKDYSTFGNGKSNATVSANAFAALQNHDLGESEDGDQDEEDDEDEEVAENQELGNNTSFSHFNHDGEGEADTEDNNDDDLYDEDGEGEDQDQEDDEEYEGDSSQNQYNMFLDQQHQHHPNHHLHHHYASLQDSAFPEDHIYGDQDEEDDDTPGTYPQFSRAQSRSSAGTSAMGGGADMRTRMGSQSVGPGASADDALVLSD